MGKSSVSHRINKRFTGTKQLVSTPHTACFHLHPLRKSAQECVQGIHPVGNHSSHQSAARVGEDGLWCEVTEAQ